jgi:biotin carboxyl carrier protein
MQRQLSATVGHTEHVVVAEPSPDGRWRIAIDGVERTVDAREVRRGVWSLLIDGASWVVAIDPRKAGTVVLARGAETAVTVVDARRKRLAEAVRREPAGGGGGVIRAPIAGKVVKVMVAAGATVAVGQPVAVLEAMKMENEIKADAAGTVRTVHVEPGRSVETSEAMITLE